jgi:hypothetical protein
MSQTRGRGVVPIRVARKANHRRSRLLAEREALTEQLAVLDRTLNDTAEARHAVAAELQQVLEALWPRISRTRGRREADPHEEALPPLPRTAVWLWGRPLRMD